MKDDFHNVVGFEWDDGNRDKNRLKHNVSIGEAEQVFFNEPLIILNDEKHSTVELRYAAFGSTDGARRLVIVFTIRRNRICVISARDMNRKERSYYENQH